MSADDKPVIQPAKFQPPLSFPWNSPAWYPFISLSGDQAGLAQPFGEADPPPSKLPTAQSLANARLAIIHPTQPVFVPTAAMLAILSSFENPNWDAFFTIFTNIPTAWQENIKVSTIARRKLFLEESKATVAEQQAAAAIAAKNSISGASSLVETQPAKGGDSKSDVTMLSVGSDAVPSPNLEHTLQTLCGALNKSAEATLKHIEATNVPGKRGELSTSVGWTFYGIEDIAHPHYLNPETFIQECDNRLNRYNYSGEDVINFFKMSLRGPAAAWFTGLAAVTKGRSNICTTDWEGLKTAFRQQHGIGGAMFYLDFKDLFLPRKSERVGPYIARVREGVDKFIQHFGSKLYDMAFPKQKHLLRRGQPPPLGEEWLSFPMPADSHGQSVNVISACVQAWPEDERDNVKAKLLEVESFIREHIESACFTYLREFLKVSTIDFFHSIRAKVEWFDCVNFLEDNKLREYALTTSRHAFKKDKPMSTVDLWNMVEQKERNLYHPGRAMPPPPISSIAALSTTERDLLVGELLATGDYGDFDTTEGKIDVTALRANARQQSKKRGNRRGGGGGGGGGGRGGGNGNGQHQGGGQHPGGGSGNHHQNNQGGTTNRNGQSGGNQRGGGGGQGQRQQQQQGLQSSQRSSGDAQPGRQTRSFYDATKWCTFCNRAGHDYQQCRSKLQVNFAGQTVVNPNQIPPGPSNLSSVSVLPPSLAPPPGPQQPNQSPPGVIGSLSAPLRQEAAASAAAPPVWSQPLFAAGIDR